MSNRDDLWSRWRRASLAHTLLYSWTGQAHCGVALFSPSPRTRQDWPCLLPQSMERDSAATAENVFLSFFFFTGMKNKQVTRAVLCTPWAVSHGEEPCWCWKSTHVLGALIYMCLSFPLLSLLPLKIKSALRTALVQIPVFPLTER